MKHFGIVTPPVPGHVNPFGAIGRELIRRGHRVTLFHMADLGPAAAAQGLEFQALGASDHPPGTLAATLKVIGTLSGLRAMTYTIGAGARATEMLCRDLPAFIRSARVDALLVDQTEPGGSSVAEYCGIPWITICNALALNRDVNVPPPFMDWSYRTSAFCRLRNSFGYMLCGRGVRPIFAIVDRYRRQWGLPAYRHSEDSFSRLAQISQQPPLFDFPRTNLPESFHYTGPFRDACMSTTEFPWDQLDGRPLVYASLGSLQGAKKELFRTLAGACEGTGVQMVLSHGNALTPDALSKLPGSPLVVGYAPQFELLKRASLTLTHAGLNTVLDSLSHGVPQVAIPLTYEQPAIAQRIQWSGCGEVVPFPRANVERIRAAILLVLSSPSYRDAAQRISKSIQASGGVSRAADVIQMAVCATPYDT